MYRDSYAGAAPGLCRSLAEANRRGAQAGRLGRLTLLFSLHAAGLHQHLRDVAQRLLIL